MVEAVLIVDPQLDFFPAGSAGGHILVDGALAVPDGNHVVEPIQRLLKSHRGANDGHPLVYVSQDWHPEETVHFASKGGKWPPHCVEWTTGADVHPAIIDSLGELEDDVPHLCVKGYRKGTDPNDDGGYSAFDARGEGRSETDGLGNKVWDTEGGRSLLEDLRADKVDTLIVCGLATDYCVKATVLDALKHGFKVWLFLDGIRAVNLEPGDGARAIKEMREAGASLYTELTGEFEHIIITEHMGPTTSPLNLGETKEK